MFCGIIAPLFSWSQTRINLKINTTQRYDSVFVKQFDEDYKFSVIYSERPLAEQTIAFSKPLQAGTYWVMGDSTMLCTFLISDNNGQQFSIEITDNGNTFIGSPENEHYQSYLNYMQSIDARMQQLNDEYLDAQNRFPAYMLKPVIDSLNAKALRINEEKVDTQQQYINDNPGTLMAGIIQCNIEIPQPAANIAQNRLLYQQYVVEHYFDNFPWNDPRVLHTPIAYSKIQNFCNIIARLQRPELDPYVMKALQSAKINKETYFNFFDQLEKWLGYHGSTMRVERIYIPMLKDMLAFPKLPDDRKRHCNYELSIIDKNHEGEIAPNFSIITDKGEKTTLHDIQSEYLLLYFQHPTCPTCRQVRQMIADFPVLNKAIATGKLKVLTVYFEDEQDVWDNYLKSDECNPKYMHGWNKDQSILNKKLYETRAIPYMFLLDKDKRILKKNILETELENQIKQLPGIL